jgi:hypothetical protein
MINEELIARLREYLKDHYAPALSAPAIRALAGGITAMPDVKAKQFSFRALTDEVSEYIKENATNEDFAHALENLRIEKGLKPAELYKRANITRQQYSRLLGPENRHPSKNTAISFGIALRLNRREFDDFLNKAGYSLSASSVRDVCVMFCIENNVYDIDNVNALLFELGVNPLSRE